MADKIVQQVDGASVGFDGSRAWRVDFASAAELVRECREAVAERPDLVVFDITESSWIEREFHTWDDIVKAVDGTWAEGVARVEELAAELEREELPRPTVIKRRRVFDEFAGDEVCVDRYRAGDPFFRTNARVRTNGPRVISILTQLGQNSGASGDRIFWRGALAVTLARLVEDAGYRTELTAFASSRRSFRSETCPHLLVTAPLKGAGDPLDVGMLTNVTSGWFFRTVYFGAMLAPRQELRHGLGSMHESNPTMVEAIAPGARPWVVSGVYDKASALKLARELLAQLVQD